MAASAEGEGQGLPFLGSLMSLISHGEIRYEGLLYQIDMPNSTIALSNVRCFGTEGRRKDGPEVPPSDQVFEYVVFKGTEIKELTVLQPPPPPPAAAPTPAPGGFQDPAIVSAGSTAPPGAGPPAAGAPPGYGPIPPAAPSPWGPPPPPYGSQFGASPWGAPPSAPAAGGGPPPPQPAGQRAPAPAPTVAVAPAQQQQPPGQQQATAQQQQQQQRPGTMANGAGAGGGGQNAPRIVPVSYAHAAGSGRGAPGRGAPRGRGGASHPRGQQGGRGGGGAGASAHAVAPRPPAVPPVEVPKEEFNFEEALKRFNKVEVLKEAGEEVPELATKAEKPAYTHDDFFDTLSCEALERKHLAELGDARPDHRTKMAAMRKQDLETFGGMARGRPAYRGRGRGYGRGGRGGGRGNAGRSGGSGRPARAEPANA